MQAYLINELERLSGVKAHTIRIWEKRYNLITPSRTDTNRRYYNDAQVRRLLNVTTLLAKGHKISKIATYTEKEVNDHILYNANDQQEENNSLAYINDLVKTMLLFDQQAFEGILAAALKKFGVYDAMLRVVYPFLNKIGVLWSVNKATPVQEHFASCIVRQKLVAATEALPPPQPDSKKFLLFLPPGEWHEIGLLFANYILQANGFTSIYLGQNVPLDHVAKIVKATCPQQLLLFYIAPRPAEEITAQLRLLAGMSTDIRVLVAGHADLLPPEKSIPGNVAYLKDVDSLISYMK